MYLVLTSSTVPLLYYSGVEANRKLLEDWIELLHRKLTGTKTAEPLEQEVKERRKEQVKQVGITDNDFEQLIYVRRASRKWKSKLKKKRETPHEMTEMLDPASI